MFLLQGSMTNEFIKFIQIAVIIVAFLEWICAVRMYLAQPLLYSMFLWILYQRSSCLWKQFRHSGFSTPWIVKMAFPLGITWNHILHLIGSSRSSCYWPIVVLLVVCTTQSSRIFRCYEITNLLTPRRPWHRFLFHLGWLIFLGFFSQMDGYCQNGDGLERYLLSCFAFFWVSMLNFRGAYIWDIM